MEDSIKITNWIKLRLWLENNPASQPSPLPELGSTLRAPLICPLAWHDCSFSQAGWPLNHKLEFHFLLNLEQDGFSLNGTINEAGCPWEERQQYAWLCPHIHLTTTIRALSKTKAAAWGPSKPSQQCDSWAPPLHTGQQSQHQGSSPAATVLKCRQTFWWVFIPTTWKS